MTSRIAADADVYGTYARISALADYLEVCALKGVGVMQSRLADIIYDNKWQLRELMVAPDEDEPEDLGSAQDLARDAADRVFSTLAERSAELGELYPFVVGAESIAVRSGFDVQASPYIAILALAVAHAHLNCDDPLPHRVLEELVEDVLKNQLRLAVNFGRISREVAPFELALQDAASRIGLQATPKAAWRSARAKDERVDTLCHLSWGDNRAGTWTILGQVTCAKSDEWERKLDEPKPPAWAEFLGVRPVPLVFLAVPHHVEAGHLGRLIQSERGIVLDRLRLTRFRRQPGEDERKLVQIVLDAELEPI
jgi:hypothetical protein